MSYVNKNINIIDDTIKNWGKTDPNNLVSASSCIVSYGSTNYNIPVYSNTTHDASIYKFTTGFGNNINIGPYARHKRYEAKVTWVHTPYEVSHITYAPMIDIYPGPDIPRCYNVNILENTVDYTRFEFTMDGQYDRDNWPTGWVLLHIVAKDINGIEYSAIWMNIEMK